MQQRSGGTPTPRHPTSRDPSSADPSSADPPTAGPQHMAMQPVAMPVSSAISAISGPDGRHSGCA